MSEKNCWGLKKEERPQTGRALRAPNRVNATNLPSDALWGKRKPLNAAEEKDTTAREEASLIGTQLLFNNDKTDKKTRMG